MGRAAVLRAGTPAIPAFDLGRLAVVVGAVAWIAFRGVGHDFISFSDGAYLYAASHGAHGLYGHVASSLPPGGLLLAAGAWRISPHVESVRLLLALLAVLVAVLTYLVARRSLGLGQAAAAAAALIVTTGPLHNQFVGLEGDAFLTPLALGFLLAVERRRTGIAAVLLGAGFFFKLTWLPFFAVGLVLLGRRTAARSLAATIALYAAALLAFGWSPRDLLEQLVVAESHSGYQLHLLGGIALGILVLWWPLLLLAPVGWRVAPRELKLVAGAAAACVVFTAKQGTFFNVLDPLEPLLTVLAVAGARRLWTTQRRLLVGVCALALVVHAAPLPPPLGSRIVDTRNAGAVDRAAAAIDAHSTSRQRVLVNPFLAVVADRREIGDAADWFILHASDPREWTRIKRQARGTVVTVDSNVESFDPAFATDTGATGAPVWRLDEAPLKSAVYAP
jgi:hypothetical protein